MSSGSTCRSCNAEFRVVIAPYGPCPRCDRPILSPPSAYPPRRGSPTPAERALLGTCRTCGCWLTVAERSMGLCDAPGCRVKDTHRTAEAHERALAEERARLAEAACVTVGEDETIAAVPSMDRPIAAVAAERAARVRAHVQGVVGAVATATPDVEPILRRAAPRPGAESSYAHLCATCRGYCCREGGEAAYLDVASLTRVAASLGLPLEALPDVYARQVPSQAVTDSCVFHGVAGCVLPAEQRSDTCNRFFCAGVIDFVGRVLAAPTGDAVALASMDGVVTRVHRFNVRSGAA